MQGLFPLPSSKHISKIKVSKQIALNSGRNYTLLELGVITGILFCGLERFPLINWKLQVFVSGKVTL
jgi:hypothetical protein